MQDTNTLTIEKIGTIVIPGAVPSVNDFNKKANHNHFEGGKFEKEWRYTGLQAVNLWMMATGYDYPPLESGVWVVVKAYRKDKRSRDIHNLFIKPIFDGFTDAGLWADDNEKVIPKVTFEYCGVDKENPRVEFEIYQEVQ